MSELKDETLKAADASGYVNHSDGHTYSANELDAYLEGATDSPLLKKAMELIQFALIYDPDTDTNKIKYTVYPKLSKGLKEIRECMEELNDK